MITVILSEALIYIKAVVQALAQVLSSEFCEIFKITNFYRTPLVVASVCRGAKLESL